MSYGKGETDLLQGRFQTQWMGAEADLDCTQEAKNGNTQRGGRLDQGTAWKQPAGSAPPPAPGRRAGVPAVPNPPVTADALSIRLGSRDRGAQATGLLRAGPKGKTWSSRRFGGQLPGTVFFCAPRNH